MSPPLHRDQPVPFMRPIELLYFRPVSGLGPMLDPLPLRGQRRNCVPKMAAELTGLPV